MLLCELFTRSCLLSQLLRARSGEKFKCVPVACACDNHPLEEEGVQLRVLVIVMRGRGRGGFSQTMQLRVHVMIIRGRGRGVIQSNQLRVPVIIIRGGGGCFQHYH